MRQPFERGAGAMFSGGMPGARYAAAIAFTFTLAFATALSNPVLAQDHRVEGRVTDAETNEPLLGATVIVEGTVNGTTTGNDGRYELTVDDANASLRFSFVGYEAEIIPIEGRSEIDVELSPATLTGTELVVVGYRVQQRQDLTGSVEVVDVESLQELPSGQISRQLQGQASGVTIVNNGQPGQAPMINIRGFNTFGNNQPLFVIDGVPTTSNDIINAINPNDVESMQVLKDAGAASIYGARASNGVVMITTRRGRGPISVSYDAQVGYQVPERDNVWNILSPQGMAELKWMALTNSGSNPHRDLQYGDFGPGTSPVLPDYILPSGTMEGEVDLSSYYVDPFYTDPGAVNDFNQIVRANHAGTDWYREVVEPAPMVQNNINVSGGGDIGQFLFSLSHLNHQGTLARTFNERFTLRANTQFNIGSRLRIGENLAVALSENPTSGVLEEGSAIGMSYRQQPIIPVRDIAGNFAGSAGSGMGNADNPVAMRDRTQNNSGESRRLFGNIFAEWDILDNVMLRSTFGGSLESSSWNSFSFPQYERSENLTTNSYSEGSWAGRNWTWTTTMNTRHQLGNHLFELVAGTEAYRNSGREVGGSASGYFTFDPRYTNLSTAANPQPGYSYNYEDAILSLIGRADYNYNQRYLLSLTIRRDGSSRFVEEQWGTFPSVTAGWRISEEAFMQNVGWLSDLKIRGGYGVMGNQLNVDAANAYTLFASNPQQSFYDIGGTNSSVVQGFRQTRIGNPAAQWERTEDVNIGFDAAFFDGQLETTVDYYEKNVRDLLYQLELPGTAGAATPPYQNVASMKNTGLDLALRHGTNIGDLRLNTRFTFTTYNNRIVEIAEGIDYFGVEGRRFGTPIIRNEVGQPMSSYFGYDIVGFWQSEEEIEEANAMARQALDDPEAVYQSEAAVGRFRYRDVTGTGYISPDDRTFLGSPNPDFTYGLNLGLGLRSWDFNIFAYGVQGAEIWNQVRWWTDFYSSFAGAKSETALYDSWTPDNRDARVAIQENDGNFSTNGVPNSYYVENGSYLRIKNLQLGYTLPSRLVGRVGMRHMRVYFQASDVLTLTGYSGIDPEIGGASQGFGIDEGAYATPRTYTLGVNLTL